MLVDLLDKLTVDRRVVKEAMKATGFELAPLVSFESFEAAVADKLPVPLSDARNLRLIYNDVRVYVVRKCDCLLTELKTLGIKTPQVPYTPPVDHAQLAKEFIGLLNQLQFDRAATWEQVSIPG